jgi:glycosyltransferase involved in cell wall biosynthesis
VTIAVLGPVYPYRGGIAHYTARLVRALAEAGEEVLTVNLTRQYPSALFPGSSQEDGSKQPFDTVSERWVDSMRPDSWFRTVVRLRRRGVKKLVIQWWHPYFAPAFGTIGRLARRAGIEVVFVCHNVEPHEGTPFDRLALAWAYGGADRFVVHAQAERSKLERYAGGRPVAVVAHPVYDLFAEGVLPDPAAARAELGLGAEEEVLLFFGLIRPYKGLEVLLRAMPAILAKRPVKLVIAGECYGDDQPLHALIEQLGIGGALKLDLKYVPNEAVASYMVAADAVVVPYLHATQSGIVQVAYAFGKPVITTRVGGIPEVVWEGETGLLVPPSDPAALAAAVERFFAEELAKPFAAGIARRLPELSWEHLARVVAGGAR